MNRTVAAVLVLLCTACGSNEHHGVGIVKDARPDLRQVLLQHDDIPGLMPAMTMNFDVADPALLDGVAPGDQVRFTVQADGSHYRIVAIEPLQVSGDETHPQTDTAEGFDDVAPQDDPAPPFALTDQDGNSVSITSLRGTSVLLDFVYTRCPGPCPVLTSMHVALQKAIPEALQSSVRFVSISLDPSNDTPAAMRDYAVARGADLTGWSFLTGEPAQVDAVLESYGVGAVREASGQIQHIVVTFLIDGRGRIAKRYFGLDHDTKEYLHDLSRVTRESSG